MEERILDWAVALNAVLGCSATFLALANRVKILQVSERQKRLLDEVLDYVDRHDRAGGK